jgi:hypothetical protein
VLGHYLGVLGIPLYALGYWAAARGLDGRAAAPGVGLARRVSRIVFALGAAGAALGAVVHGMTTVVLAGGGRAADGDPWTPFQPYGAYLGPLWLVLVVALLVGSIAFARAVWRGDTAFPRWMAATAPAILLVATSAIGLLGPRLEAFLLPAGPNVVHALFFAAVAATLDRACRSPRSVDADRPMSMLVRP